MGKFWAWADRVWNENRFVAWAVVLCGAALLLWATLKPQSPGVSIGLLALAAGIMSIRPKMHPAEKTAWAAFLIAFAVLEVLAIKKSDADNKDVRDKQNAAFGVIVQSLKDSMNDNKTHFDATTKATDGVMKKTQIAADEAVEAANNITGDHGFCYLEMHRFPGSENLREIEVRITSHSKYLLHRVEIRVVNDDDPKTREPMFTAQDYVQKSTAFVGLGEISPQGMELLTPTFINTGVDKDKNYTIYFYALNMSWREQWKAKKVSGHWEEAIRITRLEPVQNGAQPKTLGAGPLLMERITPNYPRLNGKVDWNN
jgi:hypothetical protein